MCVNVPVGVTVTFAVSITVLPQPEAPLTLQATVTGARGTDRGAAGEQQRERYRPRRYFRERVREPTPPMRSVRRVVRRACRAQRSR